MKLKRDSIAPHNLALLRFIRQHQPVGTYDAFSVFDGAGEHVKTFARRLAYLQQSGWIINQGSTWKGIWGITPKAVALLDGRPGPAPVPVAARLPVAADDAPGTIVPPRRVDVMHGPLYRPPAMTYRDGALDHQACASITAGRPVPFKGGAHV